MISQNLPLEIWYDVLTYLKDLDSFFSVSRLTKYHHKNLYQFDVGLLNDLKVRIKIGEMQKKELMKVPKFKFKNIVIEEKFNIDAMYFIKVMKDGLYDDDDVSYLNSLEINVLNLDLDAVFSESNSKVFEMIKNIKSLKLDGCKKFTDTGLKWVLNHFKSLNTLSLSFCQRVQGEAFKELSQTEITNLNLEFTNIKDKGLGYILSSKNNLKELYLNNCEHFSGECFGQLSSQVRKSIEVLEMNYCCGLKEEYLDHIVKTKFPSLKKFSLSSVELNDEQLSQIFLNFNSLKELELRNTGITGEAFLKVNTLKNLRKLDLSESKNLQDNGLDNLFINSGNNLHELNLSECEAITGSCFEFGKLLNSLEKLTMNMCNELKKESFNLIFTNLKKLKEFSVSGCEQVNPSFIEHISFAKSLKVLDVSDTSFKFEDDEEGKKKERECFDLLSEKTTLII